MMQKRRELEVKKAENPAAAKSVACKHHPFRSEIITKDDMFVITNHFIVDMPAGIVLYEYHVENFPPKASRAKKKVMILDMLEVDQDLYNLRANLVTGCKKEIITSKTVFKNRAEPTVGDRNGVTVDPFEAGNRGIHNHHTLAVTFVKKHSLDGLKDFINGVDERYEDTSAKEALNIFFAKSITENVAVTTQRDASGALASDVFQVGDNRIFTVQVSKV